MAWTGSPFYDYGQPYPQPWIDPAAWFPSAAPFPFPPHAAAWGNEYLYTPPPSWTGQPQQLPWERPLYLPDAPPCNGLLFRPNGPCPYPSELFAVRFHVPPALCKEDGAGRYVGLVDSHRLGESHRFNYRRVGQTQIVDHALGESFLMLTLDVPISKLSNFLELFSIFAHINADILGM